MKNNTRIKKLELARETLRQITHVELRYAAGGDTLGCPGHTHGNNCRPTFLGGQGDCNGPTHGCFTVGSC